jgi:DNA-binding MarR family transcriptional regulator
MPKSTATEKIIAMILSTSRSFRQQAVGREKVCRLSILQIETLRFIRENRKVLMKELAEYLYITPPSATSLVDELFEQKLVRRAEDKKDRRITKISLTTSGKRLLANSLRKKMDQFRKKIEILNTKEKKSLLKILEKLAKVDKNRIK